jgi:hypothetical protein
MREDRITGVQYSGKLGWKREYRMLGNNRITPYGDSRFTGQRTGNDDVHPIGDVLAELLDQYRVRFPDISVMVVEQPSSEG